MKKGKRYGGDSIEVIHSQQVLGWIIETTMNQQPKKFDTGYGMTVALEAVADFSRVSNQIYKSIAAGRPPTDNAKDQARVTQVAPAFVTALWTTYSQPVKVKRVMKKGTYEGTIRAFGYSMEILHAIDSRRFDWEKTPSLESVLPVDFRHPDLQLAKQGWPSRDIYNQWVADGLPADELMECCVAKIYQRTYITAQEVLEELKLRWEAIDEADAVSFLGNVIGSFCDRHELTAQQFCKLAHISSNVYQDAIAGNPITMPALKNMAAGMNKRAPGTLTIDEVALANIPVIGFEAKRMTTIEIPQPSIKVDLPDDVLKSLQELAARQGVDLASVLASSVRSFAAA